MALFTSESNLLLEEIKTLATETISKLYELQQKTRVILPPRYKSRPAHPLPSHHPRTV